MTDDGIVHRQLMRMHGFSLMSMVLTELAEDKEIVKLVSSFRHTGEAWLTLEGFGGYEQVETPDQE